MAEHLAVVACGAPLATRIHEIAAAAVKAGWVVHVVGTRSALRWVDQDRVEEVTGSPVLVDQRGPDEAKRFPVPQAVLVCPATFNTVNKLAAGIADDYAAGFLCEALAAQLPMTVVPMVSKRLWGHPVWSRNLRLLAGVTVRFVDVQNGESEPRPIEAGREDQVVTGFDPAWVITRPA
jgi:phosphopantothenoylcysteine synthetase/decarboxylase